MTLVLSERDILTMLLKGYKDSPCLWDTSHTFYFNKETKMKQYETLLETYRLLNPDATVSCLKKKLEHCRAAYRKERNKMVSSAVNGSGTSTYKPVLWYYNLLTFLNVKSQKKETTVAKSSDEDEDTQEPKKRRMSPTFGVCTNNGTEETQNDTYEVTTKEKDYIASYAESIAKQLRELDEPVRYETERIISDVIYRARTGTLPKYTPEVVDTFMIPEFGPSWYDETYQDNVQVPEKPLAVTLADGGEQTESN